VQPNGESQTGWAIGALGALAAASVPVLALVGFLSLVVTILSPASPAACTPPTPTAAKVTGGGGEWLATAYGPPWGGIQGEGVTKTGIDLRPAKRTYLVAVDPSVIPLGSYVHVWPNPWGNREITFLAGDTGGAIIGKHVEIYDWEGRIAQEAWGERHVTVTPAARTGAAGVLEASPASPVEEPATGTGCEGEGTEGPLPLTPGQRAKVLPSGLAAAPAEAPQSVKNMIAAGNRLDHAAYGYGAAHGTLLSTVQPAYDCSSAVSFVLHAGGKLWDYAEDSTELESYGLPGPGKWVSVYANSEHAFMYVAYARFDTSHNGTDTGPNREQDGPRWRVFPEVPQWAAWVVRHPPGL